MKGIAGIILAIGLLSTPSAVAQQREDPPTRSIPGITAEDSHPRACVDCHIVYEDQNLDVRLSTLLKQWTVQVEPDLLQIAQSVSPRGVTLVGKHPSASYALSNMPSSCKACHSKTEDDEIPLGPMVHLIHLTGGESNPFLTVFQGECTHCHKLDVSTGEWSIPSGPEIQPDR